MRINVAIEEAIRRKPKAHDFVIDRAHPEPAVPRHMSVTGDSQALRHILILRRPRSVRLDG